MKAPPRYRLEDGAPCVDVRATTVEQLFDNRDPAPFRDRDLDPDLVEYLTGCADDLRGHGRWRVIVWLAAPRPGGDVAAAFRAHFQDELDRLERRRRSQRRIGQVAALVGAIALFALVSLARLAARWPVLREGLLILGWVALWRPVEDLIYDWLPVHHQRRVLRDLLAAPVELRGGPGPAPPTP